MSNSPWAGDVRGGDTVQVSRILEVATVLLLALATVGSAWSAFQVSRWNGVETDEARISGALRIEGSRQYSMATQAVAYDAAIVAQYAQAVVDGNTDLQAFLRATLVRPDFLPILEAWQADVAAGTFPENLVEDEEYLNELFAESRASDEAAAAATVRSEEAGATADEYVTLTLFFATALFFAGVTASFRTRLTKLFLITASVATMLYAGSQLVGYPVA